MATSGTENFTRNEEVYNKIAFIDEILKGYNLLKEDSNALKLKQLNFTHLDLELEEGTKYFKRVTLWLDFITTVYVMFDKEPIILTESGAVPSLRHLIGNLFNKGILPQNTDSLDFVPVVKIS